VSLLDELVPGLWRFTVRRNGIPWVERADEFGRCAANPREGAAQYFNREQLLLTNSTRPSTARHVCLLMALVVWRAPNGLRCQGCSF